jgi:hypothetical protein
MRETRTRKMAAAEMRTASHATEVRAASHAAEVRAASPAAAVHPSSHATAVHPSSHAVATTPATAMPATSATAPSERRRRKGKRGAEHASDEAPKDPVVHPTLLRVVPATEDRRRKKDDQET